MVYHILFSIDVITKQEMQTKSTLAIHSVSGDITTKLS
jgi:hypothetical protein